MINFANLKAPSINTSINRVDEIVYKFQKRSINLLIKSGIYNRIINIYLHYLTRFWLENTKNLEFYMNNQKVDFNEFFKYYIKNYLIFGITAIEKIDNVVKLVCSNSLIFKDNQVIDTDTNISYDLFDVNFLLSGVSGFVPYFYSCFEEIEHYESLKMSYYEKMRILTNLVGYLSIDNPALLGNMGIIEGPEDIAQGTQSTLNAIRNMVVKSGTIFSALPGTSFVTIKVNDSLIPSDSLSALLEKIAAQANVPPFLLTGDLNRINYAASRAALADFTSFTNNLLQEKLEKLMIQLGLEDVAYTLPQPITASLNELKTILEFTSKYQNDDEMKRKLQLGGLL